MTLPEDSEPGQDVSIGDAELSQWLSEVRAGSEARQRERQRWLEQIATDEATFVGVLTDLAESGAEIVLETLHGRRHTGRVEAVGLDFTVVVAHMRWIFIPHRAVATVRAAGSRPVAASGARKGRLDLTLQEALADQLSDRPRLVVWLASGERVQGNLHGVGQDLITLRVDGNPPRFAHVVTVAIEDVTFAG